MNTTYPSAQIKHRLTYAKQQLQMPELPLYFKAVSYIRICSNALVASNKLLKGTEAQGIRGRTHAPYLNFLRRLTLINEEWWTTCFVDSNGLLASNDEYIHMLLQVLNSFLSSELSSNKAA